MHLQPASRVHSRKLRGRCRDEYFHRGKQGSSAVAFHSRLHLLRTLVVLAGNRDRLGRGAQDRAADASRLRLDRNAATCGASYFLRWGQQRWRYPSSERKPTCHLSDHRHGNLSRHRFRCRAERASDACRRLKRRAVGPCDQERLRDCAVASSMTDSHYNVIIIGGGVVGLGVALEITRRFPHLRLLLLEKEDRVARHQSGHNSGVIHSGVYYKPGSLKARLCVTGAAAMVGFCREHGIAHNVCGKVIVATHADELPRLEELRQRGEANGLTGLRMIGPEELREIEPHATGLRALVLPSTGITDYAKVCEKYAELISAAGGTVLLSAAATGIRRMPNEIVVETSRGAFSTASLINCAGLFSDRISRMAGDEPGVMIVPFRGEYYDLVPERAALVKALIYPVPDPRFPFLGVHFTRRITGRVDAGPNAVFALAREGYRHTDINLRDLVSADRNSVGGRISL